MAKKTVSKTYTYSDGDTGRSAKPGCMALTLTFGEGDDAPKIVVDASKFSDEVRHCATYHGLSQKIGDSYASLKDDDSRYEAASAMVEHLMTGVWVAEGEGAGPRITLLVEAIMRAAKVAGKKADEAAIAAKCSDKETGKAYREGALKNAQVAAQYEQIKAERAAERAAKKAEAAKQAADKGLGDLL